MLFLGLIIGLVLGYVFKPQIEKILVKAVRYIKAKSAQSRDDGA